jgi:hypothetical protein
VLNTTPEGTSLDNVSLEDIIAQTAAVTPVSTRTAARVSVKALRSRIQIALPAEMAGEASAALYNLQGKLAARTTWAAGEGARVLQWSPTGRNGALRSGKYTLRLRAAGWQRTFAVTLAN